jgi:hypothetical protein
MPAIFALATALINRNFFPTFIFFAIAFACQAAMFPRLSVLTPKDATFKIE